VLHESIEGKEDGGGGNQDGLCLPLNFVLIKEAKYTTANGKYDHEM
jgi:hypothetical protein